LPKIAIVAALARELQPLIKDWPSASSPHEGREFTFYDGTYAIAVCGGIGPEAARRAAEAIIVRYAPGIIISAGVAGAAAPELHVGEAIFPATVIDTADGSRHQTSIRTALVGNTALGRTVLASSPEIAGATQKQQLAKSYGAHAVDMEAAAVAKAAEAHRLPFLAIKAISDEFDCELPALSAFIRHGQFQTARFLLHITPRPWLWPGVLRLARNTRLASESLCAWLRESVLTNTIVTNNSAGRDARASTNLNF
jgi:nucleoside phosphorylase